MTDMWPFHDIVMESLAKALGEAGVNLEANAALPGCNPPQDLDG